MSISITYLVVVYIHLGIVLVAFQYYTVYIMYYILNSILGFNDRYINRLNSKGLITRNISLINRFF